MRPLVTGVYPARFPCNTDGVTPSVPEPPDAEGAPTSLEVDSYWVNLDSVDLAPLLAEVEHALSVARLLAEFADDGEVGDWVRDERTNEQVFDELTFEPLRSGALGSTGADLLSRLASRWERVSAALAFKHVCDAPFRMSGTDVRRHDAIGCLRGLDRTAFKECSWAYRTEPGIEEWMVDVYYADTLAPGSRLGMPHSVFARRLAVAAELLREAVGTDEPPRSRMTAEEANEKAMKLAEARKENFLAGSARAWAKDIGCSPGLVINLPLWQVTRRESCGR